MRQFIILDKEDMQALNNNQPVYLISKFDNTKIVICTKENYDKQYKEDVKQGV